MHTRCVFVYVSQRVEVTSNMWKSRYRALKDFAAKHQPDQQEILDIIMGLHALDRTGIEHTLKQETAQFVSRGLYTAYDYVGFHVGQIRDLQHNPDKFSLMTAALHAGFYSNKVGISIGVSLADIMEHAKGMRAYKMPNMDEPEEDDQEWVDQITMVFNLVHVCTNFGELRMHPFQLQKEYTYLTHPDNMVRFPQPFLCHPNLCTVSYHSHLLPFHRLPHAGCTTARTWRSCSETCTSSASCATASAYSARLPATRY